MIAFVTAMDGLCSGALPRGPCEACQTTKRMASAMGSLGVRDDAADSPRLPMINNQEFSSMNHQYYYTEMNVSLRSSSAVSVAIQGKRFGGRLSV